MVTLRLEEGRIDDEGDGLPSTIADSCPDLDRLALLL